MRALVFTILINTMLRTLLGFAQASVTDYVYGFCNTANIDNSFSNINFNAVTSSLLQNSSRFLYNLASSEIGSQSNYVHGMYQCRGDISPSDCYACVLHALTQLQSTDSICGNFSRGVRVQYQGCYLRYETYEFTVLEIGDAVSTSCNGSANDSSPLYRQNLGTALNNSVTAAPVHLLFGYNATSVGSGSNTAYALSQCVGYLSSSECATCLSQVSNYSDACNRSVSGQVYFVDCYYLFGNTSLVFTYNTTPPPSQVPVPQPTVHSPAAAPTSQTPTITSPSPDQRRRRNHNATIVGIVVGICAFLAIIGAALALCVFLKRQKQPVKSAAQIYKAEDPLLSAGEQVLATAARAMKFSLKELQDATDSFHTDNKLGEGGFGPVYQGRLKSGKEVAIKMLSAQSRQGKSEFVNEVNLITTVQHRNLIQLIGYCMESSKPPILVYEYLPNRSLDLHLFDVNEDNALDWQTRFNIIMGVARGLRYLHEEPHVRIIHRDIKASNILLDNNLNPKIADFGLARLFADDTTHVTTRVVGTLGYLAPEYAISGQLTEKADVYSFGLVALEIVSGRKVVDTRCEAEKQNLLDWTWALYEKQQQLQLVDKRMQKAEKGLDTNVNVIVDEGEVIRVVHVALLCTQLQPQLRPSMSEVHNMLCGQSEILNRPTKPMTVGMLSLVADLVHDGSPGMFSRSDMPSTSQLSVQLTYSYDASPISQVESR